MDLASVPGVTPEAKAALNKAGIATTADLARAADLADVAARSGLPLERVEGMREAARSRIISILREAGVRNELDLVAADPAELAFRSGMSLDDVTWFQAAARESMAGLPPSRVVLRPGASTARVRVEGDAFESVPMRVASEGDDPRAILAETGGNVVVLRAGDATGMARVSGHTMDELPLYAESADRETRVRVARVVVGETKKEKKGLFGLRRK